MDYIYIIIRVSVVVLVKEVISVVVDKLGFGEGLIIVKMSFGGGNSLFNRIFYLNRNFVRG